VHFGLVEKAAVMTSMIIIIEGPVDLKLSFKRTVIIINLNLGIWHPPSS